MKRRSSMIAGRLASPAIAVFSIVTALALQGCEDAARPLSPTPTMSVATAEPAPLVPRLITPQATDPDIDWVPTVNPQFNHHYVWLDASRPSNSKLFVFMPGTGGAPRGQQLLHQEAARLGYHVIGLMYQNSVAVIEACTGSPDPDCSGNMRLEVIDGIDRSTAVAVSPANSIDNRLAKLLQHLDAQHPGEGWSAFLKDAEPDWSRIVVGGHSQGAGQAAMIGTIRSVKRVLMFSGPPDARVPGEIDPWVTIGATPAAKYFGLVHQRDHNPGILPNFEAFDLGRFGDAHVVELSEPPYAGARLLLTDLEPQGGYVTPNPHRSTAVDAATPRGPDGTPRLRDAWRYMLGDRSESGGGI